MELQGIYPCTKIRNEKKIYLCSWQQISNCLTILKPKMYCPLIYTIGWLQQNFVALSLSFWYSFTKTPLPKICRGSIESLETQNKQNIAKNIRRVLLDSACGGAVPNPNQTASIVSSLFCNFFHKSLLNFVRDYARAEI